MKKRMFGAISLITLLSNIAFADAIIEPLKDYNIAGMKISFYVACAIISLLIITIIAVIVVKKIKSKISRTLLILVAFAVTPLIVSSVLPLPQESHGLIIDTPNSIEAVNENLGSENEATKLSPLVTMYNQRFKMYEGKNKSASEIMAMINAINSHNSNTEDVTSFGKIEIVSDDINNVDESGAYSTEGVHPAYFYSIEIVDYHQNGAIKTIKVVGSQSRFAD